MEYDVKIGDQYFVLVRDPDHVHPPEVHRHLGTRDEAGLRRLLDAVEQDHLFDPTQGRDPFGIGVQGTQ